MAPIQYPMKVMAIVDHGKFSCEQLVKIFTPGFAFIGYLQAVGPKVVVFKEMEGSPAPFNIKLSHIIAIKPLPKDEKDDVDLPDWIDEAEEDYDDYEYDGIEEEYDYDYYEEKP